MAILDETTTFGDYLKLEDPLVGKEGSIPSVSVFYKANTPKNDTKTEPLAVPSLPDDSKNKVDSDVRKMKLN